MITAVPINVSASGHGMDTSNIKLTYHCSVENRIVSDNKVEKSILYGLVGITVLNLSGSHDEIIEINEVYLNENTTSLIKNSTRYINAHESHLKLNMSIVDSDMNGYADHIFVMLENTSWWNGEGIWYLDKNWDVDSSDWINITSKFAQQPLIKSIRTEINEGLYHFEISVFSEFDFNNDTIKERGITTIRETAHYAYSGWLNYYIHKETTEICDGINTWYAERTILIQLDGTLSPPEIMALQQNSIYLLGALIIFIIILVKRKK